MSTHPGATLENVASRRKWGQYTDPNDRMIRISPSQQWPDGRWPTHAIRIREVRARSCQSLTDAVCPSACFPRVNLDYNTWTPPWVVLQHYIF